MLSPYLVRLRSLLGPCYFSVDAIRDVKYFAGTTKIENLEANTGSLGVKLKAEEVKRIGEAIPVDQVGGDRDYGPFCKFTYKIANTPPYTK